MRRVQRLIAACVLIAFSGVLAGCSSSLSGFDPTDLLDWLDTKKKLPGERKPVFPDGVPGVEQGVPRDMYKGAQQQPDQNPQVATAPPPQVSQQPLEPPPGSPAALKKLRSQQQQATTSNAAAAPATGQAGAEPDGEAAAASQADGTQGTAPSPKPKKIVRRRTTAPPPDQTDGQQGTAPPQQAQSAQQSAAPFPAPLPSNNFSR
jgi:hypothetical protein